MKYLGYIPLIFAFVIGFQSWHTSLVGLCALASTVIFMSARRSQVKHKDYTGDRNMLLDGAYLIAVQALIMFATYLLGWLIAHQLENIMEFLHIG